MTTTQIFPGIGAAGSDIAAALSTGLTGSTGGLSSFNQALGLDITPNMSEKSIENNIKKVQENFSASGPAIGANYHVLFGAMRRKDPLMNYSWFCNMPTIDGVNLPWYYVEEFVAPFRSFDVQSRFQQGKMYHYAGQQSLANITLKIYDDSTGKAGAYLEAWRGRVSTYDGVYSYPNGPGGYKKTIDVVVLDVSRFIQVYQLRYEGCWPVTTDPLNLGSGSSDRIIQGQEFSVDNFRMVVRDYNAASLANVIFSSLNNFPLNLINQLIGVDSVTSVMNGVFATGANSIEGYGRE